jgi:hypothetical protein
VSTADDDRLAVQLRSVAKSDRGIEGIHVDMDDVTPSVVGRTHQVS